MRTISTAIAFFFLVNVQAQKIDSIFVNLYTDSLKPGTFNYINIDGLLSNGTYLPLDSNDIIFQASDGKFFGNNLWIDSGFKKDKVSIKVTLKSNRKFSKEFEMFIKKQEDPALKTEQELLEEMKRSHQKKKIKNA